MKKYLHKYVLKAAILIGLAQSSVAQTTWTGDIDNDWNTAGNWDNGVPVNAAGATVTIAADGANVTMSAPGVSRTLLVGGNGAAAPVLNVTQNLTVSFSRVFVGSNGGTENDFGGTVNHTSGTFLIGGSSGNRDLRIAHFTAASPSSSGNSGTYNFGGASGSAPILEVLGGLTVGGRGGETGVLSLSGYGTLTQGFGASSVFGLNAANGTGILNITGGNLTINLANDLVFGSFSGGKSVLNATIDSTGFSTIHVGGNVSFGGNTLARSEFNLSLADFAPTVGSKYTIISADGSFVGPTYNYFGNVAHNDILTVNGIDFLATYNTGGDFSTFDLMVVPEPSSLALLAVGLLAVAFFHRRRAA